MTCSATDWPGLSVTGNDAPVNEKPVPEIDAELTVSAELPLEVMVSVWVAGLATVTLPNAMDVGLIASTAVAAFSCSA